MHTFLALDDGESEDLLALAHELSDAELGRLLRFLLQPGGRVVQSTLDLISIVFYLDFTGY